MKQINICLIGAGGIAAAHVAAVEQINGPAKIVAVADPNTEAAQAIATKQDAKAYKNFDEVIADTEMIAKVDAVIICTPPSIRIPLVEAAIANGKHVLMEKPIASSLEDAQKLATLASGTNLVCAMAYCHRFEAAIVEIKKMVESGEFGKFVRFENIFAGYSPQMKDHWMSNPAVSGGGSLIDTACHSLDMFQYLAGTPQLVGATLFNAWEGRGESNATVLVKTTDSDETPIAGFIGSGWNEPMRFDLNVITEKAIFSYDYCKPNVVCKRLADKEGIEEITLDAPLGRFGGQLKAFVEKIQEGKDSDLATFEDGLAVAKVVAEAQAQCACV